MATKSYAIPKKETVESQITALAQSVGNQITNLAETVDAQMSVLEEEVLNINGMENADLLVDPDTNFLYISNNGTPIGWGVRLPEGGSGGGGTIINNAIITLTNNTGWVQKTTAYGFDCVANFAWSSMEQGAATGNGIMRVNVNSIDKYTSEIVQGNISVNLGNWLALGANTVKIFVSDIYGNTRIILLNISTVSISLESSFIANTPFLGAIHYTYTPTGEASKTMHFVVDGIEIGSAVVTASGREQYYDIAALSHGSHSLLVYFTATIENQEVTSNELYYDLMCLEAGGTNPIIASAFRTDSFSQYATIAIPYRVYNPSSVESTVELYANNVLINTISADRDEQTWSYRATVAGQLVLKIVCSSVEKTFTITIAALNIDVAAETSGLSLHLTSYGRDNGESNPAIWEYGGVQSVLTGFNWVSDGWQTDEDGVVCLRVTGDARVMIPHNLFSGDSRVTGKTIEIDFATKDVLDYETDIISCYMGGIGIKINPQKALIESEQSQMETLYKENEHIRLSFVIEKQNDHRLIFCYVNGILSRAVQYPVYDNFTQAAPVGISIGTDLCTTDIYSIRVYDTNLTRHQLLNNWIADTQIVEDMLERYNRNNIFDEYGNIIIAKLPNYLPYLILTAPELPQYKGDKKIVTGSYVDPLHPEKSFTFTGASANVQGTSSQYYARKNYKIDFKNGFDYNGVNSSDYRLRDDSIPEHEFTFKADVASSEGVNNTELVRIYNDTCPFKTPPQMVNPVVRQAIDGFPIVVFWNNGTQTSFLGKYNFNNDKADLDTFGFTNNDESWEILNNTSDRVLFKSGDFTGDGWMSDFEARQPEDYFDTAKLQPFVAWVASTDQSAATGSLLPAPVTYEGVEYAVDIASYRLAKFKAELETQVELESVLFYYLFTELFLMTDSRAKNAFPTKFDTGKWCFLPYDADTAMGTNNEGSLVFSYELEDIDLLSGATIFNGQNSVLWINLRQAFYPELITMYQDLRSTGELSYQKVKQIFEDHQAKWSEAIFNEDAFFKYLEPLFDDNTTAYLGMLQGSKAEQRKWFLYNRFRYLDSKYQAGDSINDLITIRGYAKSNVTITPYADIYATVKYGSYTVQERALRGSDYTLECPLDNVNDTEIYIYSASQLKSVGDLSGFKVGYAEFSLAAKLQSLKLGDSAAEYSNTNLTVLHLGNNVLLQTLDVRNCPNLIQTVDLSGCTNIENIYFDGTATTGVILPNGGVIKVLHLPGTITNLTIKNQGGITDFSMPSYENINTLRIENTPNLPLQDIIYGATELSRVRLIGIDESFADDSILGGLMNLGGLDEQNNNINSPVVTGKCYITTVGDDRLLLLQAAFPDLQITYGQILTTYVVTFKNWDDTVLDVQYVVSGESAIEPITRQYNPIATPTKAPTAQYTFAYLGWDSGLTNIFADKTIKPTWTQTINKYTVSFYNGATLLQTINNVNYGSSAAYTGAAPVAPEGYLFEGWLPSNLNIQGDTVCIAQFSEIAMPDTFKSLEDLTWGEIAWLLANGTIVTPGGIKGLTTDGGTTVWFSVGSEKTLLLNTNEALTLQVYDFQHDTISGTTDKAKITFGLKYAMATTKRMNATNTNVGGWDATELRGWMNTILLSQIPYGPQGLIKQVDKYTTSGGANGVGIITSTDKLFLPSYEEVGFPGTSIVASSELALTSIYPKFTTADASRIVKISNSVGAGAQWWTRSTRLSSGEKFQAVGTGGTSPTIEANALNSIVFCFCI